MALDRERIVAEAVALLDANGLDGVTLRKLAQRLGVQAPTLYWHIPNKAALVTAIAEAILEQQFPDLVPPASHPDGALGGCPSQSSGALEVGRHWVGSARRRCCHLVITWASSSRRNSKNARVSSSRAPAGVSDPTALMPSWRSCSQRATIWSRRVTASYQVSLEMR
jgi:AcrR family transcriptional regulator